MKKNLTKILLMIAVITAIIGAKVYADYIMNASEVEYTKSDSTKVSVKAALDDLYTKASSGVSQIGSIECSQTVVELTYTKNQSITITNPGNVDIEVESSDASVATVTKNSNTEITINALSKTGYAKININVSIGSKTITWEEIKVGVLSSSDGALPVEYAKAVINESNIASYIGRKVDYNPIAGGIWNIFYLDTANKYGDGTNTLYIKRNYNSSTTLQISSSSTSATYYTNESNSTTKAEILADMIKFNPEWGRNDGAIGNLNENHSAYMCHRNNSLCAQYVQSGVGEYAVLSPSVEMYMDSYNQWGGYTSTTGPQSYKWQSSSVSGYAVGVNGTYSNSGYAQSANSLSDGPNYIYCMTGGNIWLASPSCGGSSLVLQVHDDNTYYGIRKSVRTGSSNTYALYPIVSLGN
ncbi:MAG: hypothetical protein IJ809_06940 [Clostridia bacterium]|nr:hypothetical protein [Clostridia bacterium]